MTDGRDEVTGRFTEGNRFWKSEDGGATWENLKN